MYKRIVEFPDNIDELAMPELTALSKVWLERKAELEKGGAYQEFLKKLQREWAIETGIIERLYGWDRGVTEVLIEQGIDSSAVVFWRVPSELIPRHACLLLGKQRGKEIFRSLPELESFVRIQDQRLHECLGLLTTRFPNGFEG